MKTALTLLAALALFMLPHQTGAQVTVFQPGCGPKDSCSQPKPVSPRYRSVTPRRYVTPAQEATVVPPPRVLRKSTLPLRNIGFHIIFSEGDTDRHNFHGVGLGLSYMMGHHWGLEAAAERYYGVHDWHSGLTFYLERLGITALWFPSGVRQNGFSYYAKAGLMYQDVGFHDIEYSSTTGQVGAGIQLRFFDGLFGIGVEAVFVGPIEESEDQDSDDYGAHFFFSSLTVRLTSGVYF